MLHRFVLTVMLILSALAGSAQAQTPTPEAPAPDVIAPIEQPTEPPLQPAVDVGTLPRDLSPWGMYLAADSVVKGVMLVLVAASVVTWTVWLAKTIEISAAKRNARGSLAYLGSLRSLQPITRRPRQVKGAVAALLHAVLLELHYSAESGDRDGIKERVVSRLDRVEAAYARRMARGTGVLATIGATAPFVGLFGTVWGIMNSFIGISQAQTTNLAVVAPGIAEALLATATGLVAAIPAVIFYNAFSRSIAAYRGLLGDAAAEILRLVSRDLDLPSGAGDTKPAKKLIAAE